jgi:ADP-heptose:LPS heptosyltransferase
MQRILAIQIKRIGDLVLTAPALRLLRRERPDAHLTLVTMGAAGQLVPCIEGIDEHLNYRSGRPNAALWSQLALGRFDVVLDFNGTDRAALMTLLSRAEVRAGYAKRAEKFPRSLIFNRTSDASLTELHTVDHMAALLVTLGIEGGEGELESGMVVPDDELASARAVLSDNGIAEDEPFVVMHPGTARVEKYWLAERWAAVADRLAVERGWKCVITGGSDAGERAHIAALKAAARREMVDLSGRINLLRSAAVISLAKLALGVDTAAMHLAAAFDVPQVALYGMTNPYHWRPRHAAARVVMAGRDEPLRELADFEKRVEKVPMSTISVAQVLVAVAELGQK